MTIANDKFSSSDRTNKDEFMVIMVLFQLKHHHVYTHKHAKNATKNQQPITERMGWAMWIMVLKMFLLQIGIKVWVGLYVVKFFDTILQT